MIFKKKIDNEKVNNYPHQNEIADILQKMEECGNFSTIIDLPTGAGKTKIASDFCVKALEDGNKVLWLSDSIDLLTQSIDSFNKKSLKRDISYQLICSTAISYDRKKWHRNNEHSVNCIPKKIESDTDILFVSMESIRKYNGGNRGEPAKFLEFKSWLETSQNNNKKLYIIYDEVHHIGAGLTETFLKNLFEIKDTNDENDNRADAILQRYVLIGLTATVYRYDSPISSFNKWFKHGWDKESASIVEDNRVLGDGTNEFINNRIRIVDIRQLKKEGILKEPKIIRVDDFKQGMPENEMEYLAQKVKRNYKEKEWNKTIIFVGDINQADKLQEELQKEGVDSFAYTSKSTDVQDDINDFKKVGNKNCKIMIAVDMVSEGFDVPDIETIYLYSAIQSQIVLRQRIGRVLRTAKGHKAKATVYWQKYFKNTRKNTFKNISSYQDKIENEQDIQEDMDFWEKGMQLPAGMYLEPLPVNAEEERNLYVRMVMLNMLELFGAEFVSEDMRYYDCGKPLYVRSQEIRGYEQFYHMIYADFWSCLIYANDYAKFSDYAKALGVASEVLLEDIKINCFYLANVRNSDTSGKVIEGKRFIVEDEDIKYFYEWVIANDLKMPELINSTGSSAITSQNQNSQIAQLCEKKAIEEYIQEHPEEKKENLLEAISLHQKQKKSLELKKFNAEKEYADILRYGKKDKYICQQLLSAQAIMANGAVFEKREEGTLNGIKGELAFIGKNENKEYYQIRAIRRTVDEIANGDTLFLAQALIKVPNHICVMEEDITNYGDKLFEVLKSKHALDDKALDGSQEEKKKKVVNEFIMALGYKKERDDIIRMQCELFGNTLPKILQYVIYCEIYLKLAEDVSFCKNDEIVPDCQNKNDLEKSRDTKLSSYGDNVKLDSNLTVVEDVIADYRPYIKAVPYYQGIKPEYLCRMLNDTLRIANKKEPAFIDAFGGSGTVTLNINPSLNMKQSYNDLGIFNKAFFDVLKDAKCRQELKEKITEFIDLGINHTGDDNKTKVFFLPYVNLLEEKEKNLGKEAVSKCIEKLQESIVKREEKYRKDFNKKVKEHNNNPDNKHKWKLLEERLTEKENQYQQILGLILEDGKEVSNERLYSIERHFHVMMLKINEVFDNLHKDRSDVLTPAYKPNCADEVLRDVTEGLDNNTKVDLAFIFFMFNALHKRGFYNDATIILLAKFIGNYEQNIDNAGIIMQNVSVCGRDALNMSNECRENENVVWYHDIPYSETSAETYVASWFNEVEFSKCLSNCKGDYIVASRFNICEKNEVKKHPKDTKTEQDAEEHPENAKMGQDAEEHPENTKTWQDVKEKCTKKRFGILKFFSRFVSEDYCSKYKEVIEEEYEDIAREVRKSDENKMYEWSHVALEKEAKYVMFAFCHNEYRHHYESEDDTQKDKQYFRNVSSLSVDSIRRMLKRTQFSNISVEVMITDMDMDMMAQPVHKLEEDVWYLPSFKTYDAYDVEPVTIIMSYKKFYKEMVLCILSNAYENVSAKEYAGAFREHYKEKWSTLT